MYSALDSVRSAAKNFTHLTGTREVVVGIAIVLAVCALLCRAGRSAPSAAELEAQTE